MPTSKFPNPPNNNSYAIPADAPDAYNDPYNDGPSYIRTSGNSYSVNCPTNTVTDCTGNECPWYGTPCPTNGPFLASGQKFDCPSFTDPDGTKPPTTIFEGPLPTVGATVTTEQLNALRDSILEEYGNRRWILEDGGGKTLRSDVQNYDVIFGTELSAPNLELLGNFIREIVERGDDQFTAEAYDFAGDGGMAPSGVVATDGFPNGFSTTDIRVHTIPTPPNIGEPVEDDDIIELINIVDSLRKACVCNTNCTCFGNCDCNWNCQCNY